MTSTPSVTETGAAALLLALILASTSGCSSGGAAITKAEEEQMRNPPTRQIPASAREAFDAAMRDSKSKIGRAPGAPGG